MITRGRFSYTGSVREVFDPVVTIGDFCALGNYITFHGRTNHRIDLVSTFPFIEHDLHPTVKNVTSTFKKGPITIKNDVWVGQGVTFLSGVTVGNGVVIGATATVAKDLDDYGVYAGNPVRLVKYRFPEAIVEKLKQIKWWEWDIEKIKANMEYFYGPVEEFVDKFYEG